MEIFHRFFLFPGGLVDSTAPGGYT